MASRQIPNIYGAATPLGEGLAQTFNAFLSAPTEQDRAANALKIHGLQTQAKRDLAAAGYDTARTEGQTISNTALRALPTLDFNAPNAQGTVMQTMGGNYSSLADPFLVHLARTGQGDPADMDRLAYAGSQNAGNTFTGFREDQARQAAKAAAENATARYGHDLDYRGKIYDVDQTQSGLDRRFNVNTPAGATTTLAPGNPLGVTTIQGNPTQDTVHGQMATDFLAGGGDPNATLSPQTPLGAAFDTKNPNSGGMTLSVGPDGTVQMTQGGGLPISPSAVKDNLDAQSSIESYARTSRTVRDIAMTSPTLFGTPGNVRRTTQALMQQGRAVMDMVAQSDPSLGATTDEAFATVQNDLAQLGVSDPMVYDPNLTDIDKMAILLAYKAASAVADQSGRGLSDQDFAKFRNVVGDPTAWLATQQSFIAGLNRLDHVALGELNAQRSRLGQPRLSMEQFQALGAGTPAAPGQQGNANPQQLLQDAQTAIARGADRRAVAIRYKQLTGQDMP